MLMCLGYVFMLFVGVVLTALTEEGRLQVYISKNKRPFQRTDLCLCREESYTNQRAKVHTSFTQVEVLVFKNTLVKVEVLSKLLYSSQSKEGFEMYFSKKYP